MPVRLLWNVAIPRAQNHLAFPEGNGIYNGGLDLLDHGGVIVLDHTDLWCCLHGNGSGQLQIMKLLLKTVTFVFQIIGCLCILPEVRLPLLSDEVP